MSVDQFWVIRHISQIVYQNKIKFYREILDTKKYILGNYHVKLSSGTYYFIGSKLQDKSYQICHTRPCVLFGTYLELQVEFFSDSCWSGNYTYHAFQPYMVSPVIHPDKRERHQDWKSTNIVRKLQIQAIWRNFGMKFFLLSYFFIYLWIIIFHLGLF